MSYFSYIVLWIEDYCLPHPLKIPLPCDPLWNESFDVMEVAVMLWKSFFILDSSSQTLTISGSASANKIKDSWKWSSSWKLLDTSGKLEKISGNTFKSIRYLKYHCEKSGFFYFFLRALTNRKVFFYTALHAAFYSELHVLPFPFTLLPSSSYSWILWS